MYKSRVFVALLGLALAAPVASAEVPERPTFTMDVLPIMQENCQKCHRPKAAKMAGMVAPFSLTSYEEARPWAKAIGKAVANREMPPWFASHDFNGVFRNDRSMTQDEVDTIVRWVDQGAKRGNPADAPEPVSFPDSEWWLGEPDLEVTLPEKIWVGDEVEDWQPMIPIKLTEEMLPEDRWIKTIEAQGDAKCVHHIVVYGQNPDQEVRTEAAGALGYGNLGGLAPGAEPKFIQDGYGIRLQKDATLRVSMHYHKEPGPGTGEWDQSRMGFYFYEKGADVIPINIEPIGNMQFEIPPHAKDHKVNMQHTFDRPFEILNYLPHMHFRGSAATYTAHYPDGKQEVLLDVPNYDYAWQLYYEYEKPKQFPAGTTIAVEMTFDNSAENPNNPDPSKTIHFGPATTDEMALGWMAYSFTDRESTD